ncbi:MAG TPA: 6-pyruvoyl-tetrahydropterin synthase-related protein [Candidatus Acidoferrales bacterium]|nr:6-pyruvoyl-tetrahydropterin synthase-related protein [Candidatus Acidoferrales bacterium]
MATATAVISPFFFLGNPSGHDIQFHLSSWMDVSRQWHEGILFPRWSEWANWGYGEPRFIFYPPVSWLLGALFGSILPWKMVEGAMIWLTLVIAGFSMWTFAREWLSGPAAIVAAVLFAADPYHLVTLYYRSDFAELLAAALFPLLFWSAIHVARGERRYVPALAVVFAVIWLSNAPAGVMATYSAVLILLVACILERKPVGLLWGALALFSGFALSAFYLFPADYEQRWVQIAGALTTSLQPSHNFLFAHNNELGFVQFNARVSRVATGMIVGTVIAGALFARRFRHSRALWWVLIAAAGASIFVMVPPSLFLWRLLPKLWFVQFPWRWLDLLAVPLALFIAGAADSFKKRWAFCLVFLIAAGAVITCATIIVQDAWWDGKDAAYIAREIQTAHGFDGMDEYTPLGSTHWDLPGAPQTDDKDAPIPPETPRVEEEDPDSGDVVPARDATVTYHMWSADHRSLSVDAMRDVSIDLRLLNYPAWVVRVDGARVQPGYEPDTGQMVLPLTAGNHRIDIVFRRTWDRTLGGVISLITALVLLFLALAFRRGSTGETRPPQAARVVAPKPYVSGPPISGCGGIVGDSGDGCEICANFGAFGAIKPA